MEQYPVSAYYALLLPNVCVLPRIVNEYCLCMMTYCLFIAFPAYLCDTKEQLVWDQLLNQRGVHSGARQCCSGFRIWFRASRESVGRPIMLTNSKEGWPGPITAEALIACVPRAQEWLTRVAHLSGSLQSESVSVGCVAGMTTISGLLSAGCYLWWILSNVYMIITWM